MDTELTIGGLVIAVGGGLVETLRRLVRASIAARRDAARADTEAKLEVARTMARISDSTAAETKRAIDALIEYARTGAQVMATIDALRTAIADAVETRRREGSVLVSEIKDLEGRIGELTTQVADVTERMERYAEFRDTPIRR